MLIPSCSPVRKGLTQGWESPQCFPGSLPEAPVLSVSRLTGCPVVNGTENNTLLVHTVRLISLVSWG